MYELFNSLNNVSSYKVTCLQSNREGGRTKVRRCEPQFMVNARKRDAAAMANSGICWPRSESSLRHEYSRQFKRMNTKMEQLANRNPKLAEAIKTFEDQSDELRILQRKRGFLSRLFGGNTKE